MRQVAGCSKRRGAARRHALGATLLPRALCGLCGVYQGAHDPDHGDDGCDKEDQPKRLSADLLAEQLELALPPRRPFMVGGGARRERHHVR